MNARQKKKHFKYKVISMKPGDILFIIPDFTSPNFEMDILCDYLDVIKERLLPDKCGICMFPFSRGYKVLDKEIALKYAEELKNYIEELE